MMNLYDRTPPQSIEAERAVLGSCLLNPDAVGAAIEMLGESAGDAFYLEAHQHIYAAIVALARGNTPLDSTTLIEKLSAAGKLEKAGGAVYVAEITGAVPTSANIRYYAGMVAETALLRSIIATASTIAQEGYDATDGAEALLDSAEAQFSLLGQRRRKSNIHTLAEVLPEATRRLRVIADNPGQLLGIPSGIPTLDSITWGFQDTDLIILGARPSTGKSALAMQCAHHGAKTRPVLFFSLEMSKEQLGQRLLYLQGRASRNTLFKGWLRGKQEMAKIEQAAKELQNLPLSIVECSSLTIFQIRTMARNFHAKHGPCFVIVDYLQLVTGGGKHKDRHAEVAEISKGLKGIAMELSIPVMALSQITRDSDGNKPKLSSFRESGAIEQDADVALLMSRVSDESKEATAQKLGWALPEYAEIVLLDVAKQRNGPTGIATLCFDKQHQRFSGKPGEEEKPAHFGAQHYDPAESFDEFPPEPEEEILF